MADNDPGRTRCGVWRFNHPAFEREPVLGDEGDTFIVGLVCGLRDIQRITRRMGIDVDQNKGEGYYEENKSDENIHGGLHELSGRGMVQPPGQSYTPAVTGDYLKPLSKSIPKSRRKTKAAGRGMKAKGNKPETRGRG